MNFADGGMGAAELAEAVAEATSEPAAARIDIDSGGEIVGMS